MTALVMIISTFFTFIIVPYITKMLTKGEVLASNFRGEKIPIGLGLTLVPLMIINCLLLLLVYDDIAYLLFIFLTAITTMTFIGIIDDFIKNETAKGFSGHIDSFLKGELTTGFLKAFIGGLIAMLISILFSEGIVDFVLNFFLVVLFTNLINLLDLRPGRAIKSYILLAVLFIIMGISDLSKLLLYIILGYCFGYLPKDIKAKSMMGDAGSNPLGISLGIISVMNFSSTIKYLLVFILFSLHILAEKYSFTKIIANNSILNFIDELGRD